MNVLLIDDHSLFREGLVFLLRPLADTLVIHQAASCAEAEAQVQAGLQAQLVLIDLAMPGKHGLEGIAWLRQHCPEAMVVALSSSDDRDSVLAAIDAGAMGFVPKSSSTEVLLAALRLILARGIYLPPCAFLPGAAREPAPAPPVAPVLQAPVQTHGGTPADLGLSPRQAEVLYLILQGQPAKRIERALGLSASTVKAHTSAVLRALNVTTRTQAVVAAGRLGLRFDGASAQSL